MAVKRVRKVKKIEPVGLSEDTKTILVVITLLMAYPIGLILMCLWMKWPSWIKILIAIPVFLAILAIVAVFLLLIITPRRNWENSRGGVMYTQPR